MKTNALSSPTSSPSSFFLGGCSASDEVIGLALKKCNMNLEEAVAMVITDESIADLQTELDKAKEQE